MTEQERLWKVERCLRNYKINTARLEQLRAELIELREGTDIHAQDYRGRVMSGAVGADPVSSYVHRVINIEHRISVLERYTLPVQQLREDLQRSTDTASRNLLLILEQHYIGSVPMTRMLEVTGWNRSTFYSRCYSLVSLAVGYFVEGKN